MTELYIELKGGPFKLESSFTTAYLKKLKDKGYYVDKISDGGIGLKRVDAYIRTDKDAYCCEIKVIDKDIFHISRLRPNQMLALRKWTDLGGTAIVLVYSKTINKYKIIPFSVISGIDKNDSIKLIFDK